MKLIILAFVILSLTSCASNATDLDTVGFFHGLWHGMIIVISFIVSLFSEETAIYAAYNSGGWYDFGFMLGLGALGGCACGKN